MEFAKVNAFSAAQKRYFADTTFAYDLAIGLADKTPLTLILICPEQPLSGGALYAFGGFFLDGVRERDSAPRRFAPRELSSAHAVLLRISGGSDISHGPTCGVQVNPVTTNESRFRELICYCAAITSKARLVSARTSLTCSFKVLFWP
jgi:hypothetical protein